jgi:integrase
MTLAAARRALAVVRTERERGIDPQGAKQATKTAAKAERAKQKVLDFTVARMIDDYLEGHVVPMRNAKGSDEVIRFLNSDDLKAIRKRPAVEVTRNEAFNLITKIRNRGVPVLAGQIKSELKAAYEFAMNAGVIDMAGNPFAFVLKGLVAAKRERTLTNAELVKLVPWIRQEYSEAVADALLITLYCGVRSGEVCTVDAREIEDSEQGIIWTIPPSKSKTKVPFNVMVPTAAAEILRKRLAMYPSGWLFPARDPKKHIEQKVLGVEVWTHSPSCPNERYASRLKCPVGDWAPHDLRRTCRTKLSELRCPVEVAEAILNHTKGGVRGNYDLYKFDAEKREWLQRWADHLDMLLTAENVAALCVKAA